jgi:hypothetical protein
MKFEIAGVSIEAWLSGLCSGLVFLGVSLIVPGQRGFYAGLCFAVAVTIALILLRGKWGAR